MASVTLLQDIKDSLDTVFKKIVRLRSSKFNLVLLRLSKAIEAFDKTRKN